MATESPTRAGSSSPPQQGSSPNNTSFPSQLRNRASAASSSSVFVAGGLHEAVNVSPTLSSFSSGSSAIVMAGMDGSGLGAHTRRVVIRMDHSIATCFDPADKELYDLWAPTS